MSSSAFSSGSSSASKSEDNDIQEQDPEIIWENTVWGRVANASKSHLLIALFYTLAAITTVTTIILDIVAFHNFKHNGDDSRGAIIAIHLVLYICIMALDPLILFLFDYIKLKPYEYFVEKYDPCYFIQNFITGSIIFKNIILITWLSIFIGSESLHTTESDGWIYLSIGIGLVPAMLSILSLLYGFVNVVIMIIKHITCQKKLQKRAQLTILGSLLFAGSTVVLAFVIKYLIDNSEIKDAIVIIYPIFGPVEIIHGLGKEGGFLGQMVMKKLEARGYNINQWWIFTLLTLYTMTIKNIVLSLLAYFLPENFMVWSFLAALLVSQCLLLYGLGKLTKFGFVKLIKEPIIGFRNSKRDSTVPNV